MVIINIAKLMRFDVPLVLCRLLNLQLMKSSNNNRLYLPKLQLNQYQNNFLYQAPKLWNLLTSANLYCSSITQAPSINMLKSRLKIFLLRMQSYGSGHEWTDSNKSISNYLNTIKHDPYYITKP